MDNWMLTPDMIARMVCCWLPTGTEALAWEDPSGDLFVTWRCDGPNTVSAIQIPKADRLLSMAALEVRCKPMVDAKLVETWTLVETDAPPMVPPVSFTGHLRPGEVMVRMTTPTDQPRGET